MHLKINTTFRALLGLVHIGGMISIGGDFDYHTYLSDLQQTQYQRSLVAMKKSIFTYSCDFSAQEGLCKRPKRFYVLKS